MAYQFIVVDQTSTDLLSTALSYKALRLQALQESPGAYSSTFEIESQFSDNIWISRLQSQDRRDLACILQKDDGTSEWVAQVTLRGPMPKSQFELPAASGEPETLKDDEEDKWQMLSLYTSPSHRGKSLGSKLCKAAFAFLKEHDSKSKATKVTVRIMVKPQNTATLGLYGALGFIRTGTCTLEEALRANGDADLLPQGELSEKYTSRSGIIMALQFDKN